MYFWRFPGITWYDCIGGYLVAHRRILLYECIHNHSVERLKVILCPKTVATRIIVHNQFFAVILVFFSFLGGTQIIPAPNVNKDIFVAKSQDYELTFQYSIASDESFTKITCGFGTTGFAKELLSKFPDQEAALIGGTTDADIRIGANPTPTPGGGLVDLKFTLRNLDENDRQRYFCVLDYKKGNAEQVPLRSGTFNLNFLGKLTDFLC